MAGSTPIYGFPYPEATDLVADYPALGQELAEDIEAALPTAGGLAPATPTSIANSGGSASLAGNTVTFTGVSSVSLNGCFTGDYGNYRVLARIVASSTGIQTGFRFRASGTDTTTGYKRAGLYAANASGLYYYSAAADRFIVADYVNNDFSLDVYQPLDTVFSAITGLSVQSTFQTNWIGGQQASATAYDGFSLIASSGTVTGTVSVYGYKS
jgi:hypothetical protein